MNTAQQYCDTIMLLLAFVVSFLATLSLASSVASRGGSCPPNGVLDATQFRLMAVDKTNTSCQEQLALTTKGTLTPITLSNDEVPTDELSFEMLGLTRVGVAEQRHHYSDVLFHGWRRDQGVRTKQHRCRRLGHNRLRK